MILSPTKLILVIALTVMGLGLAYLFHIPLVLGFIIGLGLLYFFMRRTGIKDRILLMSMRLGIFHTKEVVWILMLVGLLIPAWTACGTTPYLIDTGLEFIAPAYFLTISFIFAAVVSLILGTSTGTLSSVGIPLIGAGALLQVPLPVLAGAIISGVFVGERMSPFSSANQLVAASTGTTVLKQLPYLLPSTGSAFFASLVFFIWQDRGGIWHKSNGQMISHQSYAVYFHYSPWLMLPVVLLLGAMVLRVKTRYCFLLSIASSIMFGAITQEISLNSWMIYLWHGFSSALLPALHSNGLFSMLDLIALIVTAGAFNGILEETQVIKPYIVSLFGQSSSMGTATLRTVLFGFALVLLSCSQTLPIMMTGRNLLPVWRMRFRIEHLSRVVGDSPMVMAALVPWNLLAILCGAIIGVPPEQYAPYAVFLWILPLLTLSGSYVIDVIRTKEFSI
jgi:NhaC family Na+:H+ antiporter